MSDQPHNAGSIKFIGGALQQPLQTGIPKQLQTEIPLLKKPDIMVHATIDPDPARNELYEWCQRHMGLAKDARIADLTIRAPEQDLIRVDVTLVGPIPTEPEWKV